MTAESSPERTTYMHLQVELDMMSWENARKTEKQIMYYANISVMQYFLAFSELSADRMPCSEM